MAGPQITFFVELPSDDLVKLFSDPSVARLLAAGGYGVSMGILDLTPQRAAIVRELENRGVPVTAWLLLAVKDGYWLNADNPEIGAARYRETAAWAAAEGLRLHRIGLDIEFPRDLGTEFYRDQRRAAWKAFRNRRSFGEVHASELAYAALIDEIHASGRTVESYHFPFLLDERASGRAFLRRCLALVDVPVDVEVFMLYASYLGRSRAHSYFADAGAIALGVTGGGVNVDEAEERGLLLTWERLEEDLLVASRYSDKLYVFSLEGSVWHEFLPRFASMDWSAAPATIANGAGATRARRTRRLIRWAMHGEPFADLLLPSRRRVVDRRPRGESETIDDELRNESREAPSDGREGD